MDLAAYGEMAEETVNMAKAIADEQNWSRATRAAMLMYVAEQVNELIRELDD